MKDRQTTAIVGGGAAGLAAAFAACVRGDRVAVYERMDRVGKKMLATGNGRGNLMNSGDPRYPGGGDFARRVFEACGPDDLRLFWGRLGLRIAEEEDGRCYPITRQASTILDTLRFHLEVPSVSFLTGTRVTGLRRDGEMWRVTSDAGERAFRRVIVCGGGMAQPKLGSDGSAYALLSSLGHRLVRPRPALTPIETDPAPIRGLAGIRVRCGVRVMRDSACLHEERGELLFTEHGVSGICVMQSARWAAPDTVLAIDLTDGADPDSILQALTARRDVTWRAHPAERLLTGLLPPRLAERVMEAAGVRIRDRRTDDLPDEELRRLAETLRGFKLRVRGAKGFDAAQVTAGGIATDGFDPATLRSKLAPGIHAAGEILDVDGDCGGFNLMFAFAGGLLAGWDGNGIIEALKRGPTV